MMSRAPKWVRYRVLMFVGLQNDELTIWAQSGAWIHFFFLLWFCAPLYLWLFTDLVLMNWSFSGQSCYWVYII
ncbi:hypothetical protein LWI29_007116 [Acer saccharum]|uniref:Uncharacterized protein n=1 Tax=Acer saccharum TaxID=4024 RepID=A0AA39RPD6_ACESA|nr:hypothetical protein LWI29_007116 [Acer saccharum]